MARMAWIALVGLPLWASCASMSGSSRFPEPNQLMAEEIRSRIAQIPYQHREELFHNLLWLAQAGEQAIPALLEALRHSDPKLRSNATWTLGQIGDRRVIVDLQALARDDDRMVRLEAARTLVMLGDIQHCPQLIEALDSEQIQVRYFCHEALKASTNQDFGYDHLSEDQGQRLAAVLGWRTWWSEVSGDPWFASSYASTHGLQDPVASPPQLTPAAPMVEVRPVEEAQGSAEGEGSGSAGAASAGQSDPGN